MRMLRMNQSETRSMVLLASTRALELNLLAQMKNSTTRPSANNCKKNLGPFIREILRRGLCKPQTDRINGTKSPIASYKSRSLCTMASRAVF